ncbi:MAG: YgcG family protein, partial [Deltaproteobacteria bacterium]|nr:YgcG family protein [Deltaproteobacteria bacterium]
MNVARAIWLAFALCWPLIAGAQVPVPPLTGPIIDQTGTLTTSQITALEQTLRAFEARKGSQVAVLIVPSSAPETIEQYSLRVAEQWKLGRKNVDDGAVLVVAKDDRALRIEVGYGLEGILNDATSKRIISDIIVPRFRQGDFYGGITDGVDRILRVIDGEPLPEPKGSPPSGIGNFLQYVPLLFIIAFVAGGVLHAVLGRFQGALVTGGSVAVVAWLVAGVVSIALIAGVIAFFFTLLSG